MGVFPDESLTVEIETQAIEMATQAGMLLQHHFGKPLEVEYKDKERRDPVTSADKASERYLSEAISHRFPSHGILAEEGSEAVDAVVPDLLWVLDPLDGTTNFVNGLPTYAVSIGVLHRGSPLAGAIFIPWPGEEGGLVFHARKAGGAGLGNGPLKMSQPDEHAGNRLVAVPGSLGAQFRVRKGLRRRAGELRVTGSIAYELALTACGVLQYAVIGGPRLWDVAAGAVIVMEAGGAVLVRSRAGRGWEPLICLGPSWDVRPPTFKEMREWMCPLIAGGNEVAASVAANLVRKSSFSRQFARLFKKVARRR